MQKELWKPIPGYYGRYEVSSLGRIRSFCRSAIPLVKAYALNRGGYPIIPLSLDGTDRTFAVHRLVANAFLGPKRKGKETNHKNGIKTDNRACNLEYVTRKQNLLHRHRVLGVKINAGSKNGRHKLTENNVIEIRKLCASGLTIARIAHRFGVSDVAISYIRLKRTWRHI